MSNTTTFRSISWLFGAFVLLVSTGCEKQSAQPKALSPGAEGAGELQKLARSGTWSVSNSGEPDGQLVDLMHSRLTDDQLRSLLKLEVFQQLRHLFIGHSQVTDKGLEHLKPPNRLEQLSLRANDITDAGLKHLSAIESLKSLDLYKTNVTDQGLGYLERLSGLRSLDVRRTDVTEEGVNKLKDAIPECHIEF